ncbi:hypothetical protein RB195_010500 [Necator americanus]|uniref:Uncharacterized protein n=1 Tax=Necator americanus TaxID=51031 RepID=A0ABR1CZB7_NECAM
MASPCLHAHTCSLDTLDTTNGQMQTSIRLKTAIPKLEMNELKLGRTQSSQRSLLYPIFLFSGSKITLSWLNSPLHRSQVGRLIENRLREIRSITKPLHSEDVTVEIRNISTSRPESEAYATTRISNKRRRRIWACGQRV